MNKNTQITKEDGAEAINGVINYIKMISAMPAINPFEITTNVDYALAHNTLNSTKHTHKFIQ